VLDSTYGGKKGREGERELKKKRRKGEEERAGWKGVFIPPGLALEAGRINLGASTDSE
jgi:hypothetical protein